LWSDWDQKGLLTVANAYKEVLGEAVSLTMLTGNISGDEVRDRVRSDGDRGARLLDEVWPDWGREERARVRRALKSAVSTAHINNPTDAEIDAFVEFLAEKGLEAFFWRLRSFEEHAFHGNAFALEAMQSDLQGMAICVEHVVAALGGTETQLYEKFKQLWRDPGVSGLLRTSRQLAAQARLANDWDALKNQIEALRREPGGEIAADLVMAHRIRGGVHAALPEDDQFELERLFVTLMRAALSTFVEVLRR
jgi:hypothetical protein